ncbi:Two-component response regulator 24 [Trifolium repens]|nr:two-component response regulator [Trifolium repens]WJX79139.1 Two-component response regulator 24 [Trifolium repens]
MASPQNFASELTALVVDDKKSYQKIHQMMLNNFGVKSHVVENGKEAVDIHLHGKKFDLILMDMDMPIMNGIEATKELRAMGVCSTIVGVTSRSTETEMLNFMEAGLDDYQEKPLTKPKLSSILGKIINHN